MDEYICMLGATLEGLRNMANIQHIALTSEWLKDDEKEQVNIAKYHIVSAFASIRSYLDLIGEHTQIDVSIVQQQLIKRWEKENDTSANNDSDHSDSVHADSQKDIQKPVKVVRKAGRPRKKRNDIVLGAGLEAQGN